MEEEGCGRLAAQISGEPLLCLHLAEMLSTAVRRIIARGRFTRIPRLFAGEESGALPVRLAPDRLSSHHLHLRQELRPRAQLRGCKQHHGE